MEKVQDTFKREILRRFIAPWKQSAFIIYFITFIIVLGLGSVAISTFVFDTDTKTALLASNISIYFISLIATSTPEIIVSFDTKNKLSFSYFSLLLFITGIILVLLSNILGNISLLFAITGMLISWGFFVVANADNPKHSDEKYNAIIAGNTKDLKSALEYSE